MFLTADNIHDGKQFLKKGTALELTDDGTVVQLHENYDGKAAHYRGIICPGFVNAHCHLELSHMKGCIPKHTGLISFLLQVVQKRNDFSASEKNAARQQAYETLWQRGVSAVGDICNTTESIDLRSIGKMHIHSFVEALGFQESAAEASFNYALKTHQAFQQQMTNKRATQSITAHAPYSVSRKLFEKINAFESTALLAVHNQECADENQFYKDKTGSVNQLLTALNIDASSFPTYGRSSLQTYTQWLAASHPIIFVHNTFTGVEDVQQTMARFPKAYFCLCPNANLYIENTLPDVEMLMAAGASICIGTDSLSSNDQLCVFSELQTLHHHFKTDWELLLQWACFRGAQALQMEKSVGSFTAGLQPGIVQIEGDEVRRIL